MNEVVYPVINYLADGLKPYMGILGFEGVLTPEGDVAIIECRPFLQDHDAQGVLSLVEDDIFKMMHSCAIGAFSDDYDMLGFKDEFALSCVLSSGKFKNEVIQGLDTLQEDTFVGHLNTKQNEYTEFETQGDRALVLTTKGKTLGLAAKKLYDEVDAIEFRGKTYRKDLCRVREEY
jgi:phosphoribosylamine-glycine ligase